MIKISGQYNIHYFTSSVLSMISRLWDTQVSLTYLRGLEIAELAEEDMPIQ
jgi:hypothetical protein